MRTPSRNARSSSPPSPDDALMSLRNSWSTVQSTSGGGSNDGYTNNQMEGLVGLESNNRVNNIIAEENEIDYFKSDDANQMEVDDVDLKLNSKSAPSTTNTSSLFFSKSDKNERSTMNYRGSEDNKERSYETAFKLETFGRTIKDSYEVESQSLRDNEVRPFESTVGDAAKVNDIRMNVSPHQANNYVETSDSVRTLRGMDVIDGRKNEAIGREYTVYGSNGDHETLISNTNHNNTSAIEQPNSLNKISSNLLTDHKPNYGGYALRSMTKLEHPDLTSNNNKGESEHLRKVVSKSDRKYKLFIAPNNVTELQDICFKFIGAGQNICIKKNCTNAHKGELAPIVPGEAFILRDKDKIFSFPRVDLNLVEMETAVTWSQERKSVEDWKRLFQAANSSFENQTSNDKTKRVRINHDDIEREKEVISTNLKHKTPAKRLKTISESELDNNIISAPKQIDIPNFEENLDGKLLMKALLELNEKINQVFSNLKATEISIVNELQEQLISNRATDTKLDTMLSDIGIKSNLIESKFDEPDLWATVGNICDAMENKADVSLLDIVKVKLELSHDHINQLLHNTDNRIESMNRTMQLEVRNIHSHKVTCNEIFTLIERDIHSLSLRLSREESKEKNVSGINSKAESMKILEHGNKLDFIDKQLAQVVGALKSVINKSNDDTIKYHNLGFTNFQDAGSFYDAYNVGDNFGLVVDFHIAMENITNRLLGQEIVTSLNNIFKIKLTDIGQAIAMKSFEHPIPKFFAGTKAVVLGEIVEMDQSYFKGITNFDVWDRSHVGLKARLEVCLEQFRDA